jgi:hypothetical protein
MAEEMHDLVMSLCIDHALVPISDMRKVFAIFGRDVDLWWYQGDDGLWTLRVLLETDIAQIAGVCGRRPAQPEASD